MLAASFNALYIHDATQCSYAIDDTSRFIIAVSTHRNYVFPHFFVVVVIGFVPPFPHPGYCAIDFFCVCAFLLLKARGFFIHWACSVVIRIYVCMY